VNAADLCISVFKEMLYNSYIGSFFYFAIIDNFILNMTSIIF